MPKDDGKTPDRPKKRPLDSPWVHPATAADDLKSGETEIILIAPAVSKSPKKPKTDSG